LKTLKKRILSFLPVWKTNKQYHPFQSEHATILAGQLNKKSRLKCRLSLLKNGKASVGLPIHPFKDPSITQAVASLFYGLLPSTPLIVTNTELRLPLRNFGG
jgi:hypothetical protein